MKYLKKEDIKDINTLMYNKALDLDVAMYNLEFDDDTSFAETSMYLYVNSDGGFGHALNYDNLNPNSTVFETYEALKTFKEMHIGSVNHSETTKELIGNAFKYLYSLNSFSYKDISNDKFACALKYKGESGNELLLGIIGFTIFFLDKESKYYKKAISLAEKNLEKLLAVNFVDYDYLEQFKTFLFAIVLKNEFTDKQKEIETKFNSLLKRYLDEANLNKDYFEILYLLEDFDLNESEQKIVNTCLDNLIINREKHGMWENKYTWGNENMYPEAMSASLKWLGRYTRYAIHYIVKYKRIEED